MKWRVRHVPDVTLGNSGEATAELVVRGAAVDEEWLQTDSGMQMLRMFVSVPTDDPDVVAAIEQAAARAGVTLERSEAGS